MQLAAFLVGVASLLLNNNKTMVQLPLKSKMRSPTAGVQEAARWTRSNSPNAWMRIRAICKYVAGIWNSWYGPPKLLKPRQKVLTCLHIYRRLVSKLPANTESSSTNNCIAYHSIGRCIGVATKLYNATESKRYTTLSTFRKYQPSSQVLTTKHFIFLRNIRMAK
jgi:hypothetical protein